MNAVEGREPIDRVRDLVTAVADGLGLDARVEVVEHGDEIAATLHGEDLGRLIGRHGQTIDAVQHLAYKVAVKDRGEPRRVVVDAAGYRQRRRTVLERQADEAADAAERSGASVALEPMNAAERKLVHEYLKSRAGIETHSEGSEPDRHLVVDPVRFT